MSSKVFITHSWHDIDFARRLYDDLVARHYEVWFDGKTLQGGHRIAEEINKGLEWCDVYLPILSPQALDSPWCWEEINTAIGLSNERGRERRPRVIPILAKRCQIPAILRGRLYFDFTDQYSIGLNKAFAAIDNFRLEQERKARERAEQEKREPQTREPALQAPSARMAKGKHGLEPFAEDIRSLSDHELVNAFQAGQLDALGTLFDRYGVMLYEFIYCIIGDRDQATRLLEQVFVRVLMAISGLGEHDHVRGWLYGLAREASLSFLRQKNWLDTLPPSDEPTLAGLAGDVWRAARAMPALQRCVLVLEELHGLAPTEKARALNVARTDLVRLINEARDSFHVQFDLQARQQEHPLLAQIDLENIQGLRRRIRSTGSLFGYLPPLVPSDSLMAQVRAAVLAEARLTMVPVPLSDHKAAEPPLPSKTLELPSHIPPTEPALWMRVDRHLIASVLVAILVVIGLVVGFGILLTRDGEKPTIIRVEPGDNELVAFGPAAGSLTTRVSISAAYRDNRALNVKSTRLTLDNRDVTATATISDSDLSCPVDLSAGPHTVTLDLSDMAGNSTTHTWRFTVASTAIPTNSPTVTLTNMPNTSSSQTLFPTNPPTIAPTNLPNISPSRTLFPTNPPTLTPSPSPAVSFSANQTVIVRGASVLLTWNVSNADQVFLNQDKVDAVGSRLVSPSSTITYRLIVTSPTGTVEKSVTITVQELPDLVVTEIDLTPTYGIRYTVRNSGAGNVTRSFLIQATADNIVVESARPVSAMSAGQEMQLVVPSYTVQGTQVIRVSVNSTQEVAESNYANNELTRTLIGPAPTPTFAPTPTPTPTRMPTPTPTWTPTWTPIPSLVTSVSGSVNPGTYSSACPGSFGFSATITMSGPGSVIYRWERSDGIIKPSMSLTFNAAGSQTVTDQWVSTPTGTGWERLHVGSPNDIISNQLPFTNNCR